MTIIVLPFLGVLSDIDNLWIFKPYFICKVGEWLNDLLENFFVWNILCVEPLDS